MRKLRCRSRPYSWNSTSACNNPRLDKPEPNVAALLFARRGQLRICFIRSIYSGRMPRYIELLPIIAVFKLAHSVRAAIAVRQRTSRDVPVNNAVDKRHASYGAIGTSQAQ